jgi:hypothetical protein
VGTGGKESYVVQNNAESFRRLRITLDFGAAPATLPTQFVDATDAPHQHDREDKVNQE